MYGSLPTSGNWTKAHRLTARATQVLDSDQPDLGHAEALLRQAIEADPAHGPAYLQLGGIQERQSRVDETLIAYAWAQRLMPGQPEPRELLERLLATIPDVTN